MVRKKKHFSQKLDELINAMESKMHLDRVTMRSAEKHLCAQPSTVWRWIHRYSEPNAFHTFHIRKWLGYL